MVFHLGYRLPELFAPVVKIGWMGVDLFFVLSGYLIGLQLLKPYLSGERPSLREFYRRRAYRILPAYLFVLLLYFTMPAWNEREGISPLWEFLTFTENLFVNYAKHASFSHVWSLCVEEHFYLVLPVLVLWLMRRPSVGKACGVVGGLVVAGVCVRSYELFHVLRAVPLSDDRWGALYIERIYYPTYTRLDGLLMGVVLAGVQTFRPEWWRRLMRRGHMLTLAGLGLFAVAAWLFQDRFDADTGVAAWGTIVGFPVLSLGLGLLVASAVSDDGVLRRVRVPGATMLATLAFGLYLTHKEIAHLDAMMLPHVAEKREVLALALYAGSCLAGAALLYFCVERPFMVLRDRRTKRQMMEEIAAEPAL